MSQEENNLWYCKGLRFACTGCGKCCTGVSGYVWVTKEEIALIAKKLQMPLDLFVKKYIRQKYSKYALIEKKALNGDYDCIFLQDKKCSIYETRPKQCTTYPWWKENLTSKEAWEEVPKECEGINEEAPLVPFETIQKESSL